MSTDVAIHTHDHGTNWAAQKADISEVMLYWRSVAKRKWAIVGVAVALSILAAFAALMMIPVYRASASVMIEQNRAKVVAIEEVYSGIGANREHFETQADILGSRSLASKVIAKLQLVGHPEFDPRQQKPPFWRTVLTQLGTTFEDKELTEKQLHLAVLDNFMQRTTVEPGRLSQLIRVSFDSTDPQLSADIANAIVSTYIENDMATRYGMTKRASEWLSERLSGLKKDLEQSERALQQYREREHLVDTRGLAQSGATRQIEDLTRALVEARQKRTEAETAYQQTRTARDNLESLPIIQRNPLMARLKEVEADAEKKVAELSKRYGPEHVRMIQAQSELRQARESANRQIQTVVGSLANEYEAARTNEKALDRFLAEAKAHVQGINRKEFQLGSLERAVATNRQIYETFLNRFKETSAANDAQGSPVARLTDPAVPPESPIKPKKQQIVLIVFVLGIFGGVLVAVFRERLDNTLKAADDVENKLGQPMLAMLPLLSGAPAKSLEKHFLVDPKSAFSEGIRTARTGILLSSINAPKKTLLVTSSVSDEGKTAVALNLAFAHAQTQRVILIDADLRQPSVARRLGLDEAKPGLTELIAGSASFADCLQRVDGSSLYAIAAGSVPPDPLELILSPRFQQMLKALTSAGDVVIIDSPPVHLFSDAIALSTMATGVVFVVKADSTPHQLARHCLRALQSVDAKLFGVILNQLDFKKAERYYGAYARSYDGYYRSSEQPIVHSNRLTAPRSEAAVAAMTSEVR